MTTRTYKRGPLVDRVCEVCGNTFQTFTSRVAAGNGRVCSRSCIGKLAIAAKPKLEPATPDKLKKQVRAHGLINSRVKHDRMPKPKACQKCGKVAPLDGHHDDYDAPGVVLWLCRSCHMRRHYELKALIQKES